MADTKITELSAASGVTADDLIPIVNDPGGTPATQKATAAQVLAYVEGAIGTAAFRTLIDDASAAAMLATLSGAPLASPTFTGTPAAPTASAGTNTTQLATTAFATGGLATHESDTTSVHGISDTSALLDTGDLTASHNHTSTSADGGVLTNDEHDGYSVYTEIAAPSTPAANTARLYTKDVAGVTEFFYKNSAGTERDLSASGGSGAPTDAKYITSAANGSLSAEIVIPGMAGSPDVAGAAGAGTSREFESGDTAPTWSSAPNATDVGTTAASHLYVKNNATTELRGLYAWAPGSGAFDARMKASIGSDVRDTGGAFGLLITDSGDSNRLLVEFEWSAAIAISAFTYASGTYTPRGASLTLGNGVNELYFRITRDGSNNCSFWVSPNGLAWKLIATQAFTLTIANIGFRSTGDATGITHAFVDWLRTSV